MMMEMEFWRHMTSPDAESLQSREKKTKIQETGTAEVFLPDQIIMKRGKLEAGKSMKWESRCFLE